MRILKALFAVVLSASFLVACGGGDGATDTTSGGGSGSSTNLRAVYDAINASSTLASVTSMVGYKHVRTNQAGGGIILYTWESDVGTNDPKILGVSYYSSGRIFMKTYQSGKTDQISQRY